MKLIVIVLSLSLAYVVSSSPLNITNEVDFETFKSDFKKSYSNPLEAIKRKAIFDANLKKINEYNQWAEANGVDTRMGVNEFTDLDSTEFLKSHTGYVASTNDDDKNGFKNASFIVSPKATTAAAWDWRSSKKVNSIKNQGNCGSCWAFSITSIAETSYAIKYSSLPVLSEQELVDCVAKNSGCNGGDPLYAANVVLGSGLMQSYYYPYVAYKHSSCYYNSALGGVAVPKYGYRWVGTEAGLAQVVSQTGPVAIVLYASSNFQSYKSGIFSDSACVKTASSKVNHAVTIVGYGTENGKDYWIVRNQWGTTWGEAGYIRLPRGSNYCALMTEPIYFIF